MSKLQDFMNKLRYWDNLTAKWMLRHFYFLFFQVVLLIIFVLWFMNTLDTVGEKITITAPTHTERLLSIQSTYLGLLSFLMIMNSFWMLFIFSGFLRMKSTLSDINYNLTKIRSKKSCD